MEDRKTILLRACMELLQKQEKSCHVLDLLTETVYYDEAKCDGYCLLKEIKTELGIEDEEKKKIRKNVDIVINQAPISMTFTCPHCGNEIILEYKGFERITGKDLCGLLYDSTYFKCPDCDGDLETDEVKLD